MSIIDVGCAGSDSVKEWFEIFDVGKLLAIDARQSAVDEVALNVQRSEVTTRCVALSAHSGEMRPFHSEVQGGFNSSFYDPNFDSDVVTAHRSVHGKTSSFEDRKVWTTAWVATETLDEVAREFVDGVGGGLARFKVGLSRSRARNTVWC